MRALALLLVLAAPAAAQDATASRLADLRLATAVRLALVDDVRTRALDVDVTASDGIVALEGSLSALDRRTALDVARGVAGVRRLAGDDGGVPDAPPRADPMPPTPERPRPPDVRPADPPAERAVYHTVARGETLFSLARRYETTVDAVVALNGMRSGEIRVGQRLRMR